MVREPRAGGPTSSIRGVSAIATARRRGCGHGTRAPTGRCSWKATRSSASPSPVTSHLRIWPAGCWPRRSPRRSPRSVLAGSRAANPACASPPRHRSRRSTPSTSGRIPDRTSASRRGHRQGARRAVLAVRLPGAGAGGAGPGPGHVQPPPLPLDQALGGDDFDWSRPSSGTRRRSCPTRWPGCRAGRRRPTPRRPTARASRSSACWHCRSST